LTPADLESLKNGDSLTKLDRVTFIKCILAHNAAVVSRLVQAGVFVKYYDHALPMHVWLLGTSSGVFGIADLYGVVDEPGFFVRGRVRDTLSKTANDVYSVASPINKTVTDSDFPKD
jgi:hypothetical protein